MSSGAPIRLADATHLARMVVYSIDQVSSRLEVCGSIRREKETVRDIDIVVIPKNYSGFLNHVRLLYCAKGEKFLRFGIPVTCGFVQINILPTTDRSWGAALMHATGSADWNKMIRTRAMRLGYKLNQYGLFTRRSEQFICGAEEDDIFRCLGFAEPVHPTERIIEREYDDL